MHALDLFAGTGWGVACRALGIEEHGVEIMPAAIETRTANGMRTIYNDVWDGLVDPSIVPDHDILIASPPCQTFSVAGHGNGRAALDAVRDLIRTGTVYGGATLRREAKHLRDERTALVLAPLAYAIQHRPMYIAFEQVPTVLPVWDECARVLRHLGYSVAVGNVNAEQYGVPQTRKRAVLVARRDGGVAKLPHPTHSKYHTRTPDRLDDGVMPWVSMASALGWGLTERPGVTVGNAVGRGLIGGSGAKQAVTDAMHSGAWIDSPHGVGTTYAERTRIDDQDAAALQTYPRMRSNYGTGGDPAKRGERSIDQPAPTVTSKIDRNKWLDLDAVADIVRDNVNDQSGTPYDAEWPAKRPALTLAGRPLIPHPGATANRFNGSTKSRNDGINITEEQASLLQTYPHGFAWRGTKTDRFLQIGNAVPPVLAMHILAEITS